VVIIIIAVLWLLSILLRQLIIDHCSVQCECTGGLVGGVLSQGLLSIVKHEENTRRDSNCAGLQM